MPTPVHPQCPEAPGATRRNGMSDPRMRQRRPLLLLYPYLPNLPEGRLGGHAAVAMCSPAPRRRNAKQKKPEAAEGTVRRKKAEVRQAVTRGRNRDRLT